MSMSIRKVSRREFVKVTSVASAGLILGVSLEAATKKKTAPPDNTATTTKATSDERTALPMIVSSAWTNSSS